MMNSTCRACGDHIEIVFHTLWNCQVRERCTEKHCAQGTPISFLS